MQDNYSLCHGDLLVMNWCTRDVCQQAGVAAGSVAGLHFVWAQRPQCKPAAHPTARPATILQAIFGQGRLFFWSALCSPTASTTTLRRMQKQGRKHAGSCLLFTQFLAGCFPARAHTNSQERLGFQRKLLCRGLLCSLLCGKAASSLLRRTHSYVMPLQWLRALPRLLQWFR